MAKEKKVDMDYEKIQTSIASLALEELVSLKADVENLIKQKQKEHKKKLYSQMQQLAQVAGFETVEEFISSQKGRSPRSDKGVRLPPKYRNPDDEQQTWSGKGRKPGWVVSHLAADGQLEELEIT